MRPAVVLRTVGAVDRGVVVAILTTPYSLASTCTSGTVTSHERPVLIRRRFRCSMEPASLGEASALRRVASFRRTDNWLDRHVGHPTAYAATNFPFGVITHLPHSSSGTPVDEDRRATIAASRVLSPLRCTMTKSALHRVWLAKRPIAMNRAPPWMRTRLWKNTQRMDPCREPTHDSPAARTGNRIV